MLGCIPVAVAFGIRVEGKDIGPADARILADMLTGNRLVQFIAALKAAEHSMAGTAGGATPWQERQPRTPASCGRRAVDGG